MLSLLVNHVIGPNRNPWDSEAHLAGSTTAGDGPLEFHGVVLGQFDG